MPCPTIDELPPPPTGKVGWPWTVAYSLLPDIMPNGTPWPRVTIITPSYNQAQFIEETLRSVLLQGYPNLEYIVMDGGSTDGTVEIISKYESVLSDVHVGRDGGQPVALALGFGRATGTILAWLNSDDVYFPGALEIVAKTLASNPKAVAVCGNELWISPIGLVISQGTPQPAALRDLWYLQGLPQPAVFFRRETFKQVGGIDLRFQFIFDFELWLRLADQGEFCFIPHLLAATRWHPEVKRLISWPAFPMELEQAIPQLLAGSLKISMSPAERKAIHTNLMHYAARVYLANSPEYIRKALACSAAAIAAQPSLAPSLLRVASSRVLQLFASFYQRVLQQNKSQKAWWAGKESGIHWSEWQSR